MLSEELKHAIELCRSGDKKNARNILKGILIEEPKNETAWMWFIDTLDSDADRITALEGLLKINPESQVGQRSLERLRLREKKRLEGMVDARPAEENIPSSAPEDRRSTTEQKIAGPEDTVQQQKEEITGEVFHKPTSSIKAKKKSPGWLLRLSVTLIVTLVFALVIAQMLGYDPIQSLFGPKYTCGCDEVQAYMERVAVRVEKWANSEGLLEISQLRGEVPSDISYAKNLLQEEKDEKVQSCMQTAHEILLTMLEAHVQYAEAITEKNAITAQTYLQVQQVKQQELRNEFARFSQGYSCEP